MYWHEFFTFLCSVIWPNIKFVEFVSSSQGSGNANKFLKVDTDGSVICDDFSVNPQDIEDAVYDYLDEHPVTVITDDELLPNSNNPVKNKVIYNSL